MANLPAQALRRFDVRAMQPAVWVLLILAIVDVVVRIRSDGSFVDPFRIPLLAAAAAPFVFAAAVVYSAPADRRLVWGALALASTELLVVLAHILQPPWLSLGVISDAVAVVRRVGPLISVAGLVLIGVALGGLRSRLALAAAGVGAAVFVLGSLWSLARLLEPSSDLQLPFDQVVITFVAPLVTVGWAFVAGAAFDRGMRLMTLGAALIVSLAALDTVLAALSLRDPLADYGFVLTIIRMVNLAAWAALVAGALTELRPPDPETAAPEVSA